MPTTLQILLWLHLLAFSLGGAAVFGIPVVGARVAKASPEARPTLFAIANMLSSLGRGALVVLLLTGLGMVYAGFGGDWSALKPAFWWKMAFVAILLGLVIFAGINAKKAQGGDMAAAKLQPRLSQIGMVLYICVVATAVLAFG
jgi:hypothetical protein